MADREMPSGNEPLSPDTGAVAEMTILHSRPLTDLPLVQADIVSADAGIADLFLRFVQETAVVRYDERRILSLISEYTFRAFPQATHLVLALRDEVRNTPVPLYARSREGGTPSVALSRTLVDQVIAEGAAVLFTGDDQALGSSKSLVRSRIRTAVCAPLSGMDDPFGVMQLDIRDHGRGMFGRKDLDRLTVFSRHVALVLDNLRLYQEQMQAFESTINALVHSLSLKDPDTAHHSERVQQVSVMLGRELGLGGSALESLRVAAILHDMGKQGVRDEVLLKPARLSTEERDEMSQHAGLTQNVLDKIKYPAHLRDVPLYAAYHHEKMNGTGPYRIPGDRIPIQSRIISVADVFDALSSTRVYKEPKPQEEVVAILERGCDGEWDPEVVEALKSVVKDIMSTVYGRTDGDDEDFVRAA